jgi:hypothetical protein
MHLDVDLQIMYDVPKLNYDLKLVKIKSVLNQWSGRLTIIGKKTVIQTLITDAEWYTESEV